MILSLVALFFVCVCVWELALVWGCWAKFSQPLYPGSTLLPHEKKAFAAPCGAFFIFQVQSSTHRARFHSPKILFLFNITFYV